MGRKRKGPWRRKEDKCWYTTDVGSKKLVKLAPADASSDQAFHLYCEYHANSEHDDRAQSGPLLTVSQLIDEYLEWTRQNRSGRTYRWYRDYLRRFHDFHGPRLRVANLRPYHVDRWVSAHFNGQSASHRHGAIRSVNRVMNWAVKHRYIAANPIAGMEKPTPRPRETTVTDEQFRRMLSLATDNEFRDYLQFVWETGCRPQEIRIIEARHFDGEKLVFEKVNSKGEKYNRVVYLSDEALSIVTRLTEKHLAGPIFQNSKGKPWTKNSVSCRFRRLKKELGIPDLCATTLRHSWATATLKNGLDSTTASILMGHRDPSTLARNYQHLVQDHEYLKQAARRARCGGNGQSSRRASDSPSEKQQSAPE
jgi:integrase